MRFGLVLVPVFHVIPDIGAAFSRKIVDTKIGITKNRRVVKHCLLQFQFKSACEAFAIF